MSSVTIFIVIFTVLSSIILADDSCKFETSKGVIDLSSVGRDDGTAAFPDCMPSTASNYKYSYNPCRPFSEGFVCQNVAACQVSMDGKYTFVLGRQDSATWNDGSSLGVDPSISYIYNEKITRVILQCVTTETGSFETEGETSMNVFTFRLSHKCACWNGCGNQPNTTTTRQTTTATTKTTQKTTVTTTEKKTTPTTSSPLSTTPSAGCEGSSTSRGTVFITTLLVLFLIY